MAHSRSQLPPELVVVRHLARGQQLAQLRFDVHAAVDSHSQATAHRQHGARVWFSRRASDYQARERDKERASEGERDSLAMPAQESTPAERSHAATSRRHARERNAQGETQGERRERVCVCV